MGFITLLLTFSIASLPFALLVKVELGIITFTPYLLGVVVLIPFTFYRIFAGGAIYRFNKIDLMLLILCLNYFVSTLFAKDVIGSGYLSFHGIFIPAASYFVCKGLLTTEKEISFFIRWNIISICVYLAILIYTVFAAGFKGRAFLFDWDSIVQGTLAVFAIIFLIYGNYFQRKIFKWILLCIALLGLVVCFSRGYLILMLFTPFLLIPMRRNRGKLVFVFLLTSTMFLTFFMAMNPEIVKPSKWDPKLENSTERLTNIDYWKFGIYSRLGSFKYSYNNFLKKPVFGSGLKRIGAGQEGSTVHNVHMEWLEYGGIIGYISYALVFFFLISRANRYFHSDKTTIASVMILLVIWLNGLTNGFMHGVMPYIAFIVAGICEARVKQIEFEYFQKRESKI
mgnify:CR=1 FL=1